MALPKNEMYFKQSPIDYLAPEDVPGNIMEGGEKKLIPLTNSNDVLSFSGSVP